MLRGLDLNERGILQLRADALNAFNTPSFSVWGINAAIGSPMAGVNTSTNTDDREFQFALKLLF